MFLLTTKKVLPYQTLLTYLLVWRNALTEVVFLSGVYTIFKKWMSSFVSAAYDILVFSGPYLHILPRTPMKLFWVWCCHGIQYIKLLFCSIFPASRMTVLWFMEQIFIKCLSANLCEIYRCILWKSNPLLYFVLEQIFILEI